MFSYRLLTQIGQKKLELHFAQALKGWIFLVQVLIISIIMLVLQET